MSEISTKLRRNTKIWRERRKETQRNCLWYHSEHLVRNEIHGHRLSSILGKSPKLRNLLKSLASWRNAIYWNLLRRNVRAEIFREFLGPVLGVRRSAGVGFISTGQCIDVGRCYLNVDLFRRYVRLNLHRSPFEFSISRRKIFEIKT